MKPRPGTPARRLRPKKTADEKRADELAYPPTTTVDPFGHLRVVRRPSSKRCLHGRLVLGLDNKMTGLARGAEVCPTCTFEAPRLNQALPPKPKEGQ